MNLDLLKKLIKLANNNPNDNEANLAARKVCLMIAEDEYKLVGGDATSKPKFQPQQQGPKQSDWSGFGGGSAFNDIFDQIRRDQEAWKKRREEEAQARRQQKVEYEKQSYDYVRYQNPYTGTWDEPHTPPRKPKKFTCGKCGTISYIPHSTRIVHCSTCNTITEFT